MKARLKPIAVLFLSISTSARAEDAHIAAWDRAPSYLCRADKLRICDGESGQCELLAGEAVFTINFKLGTFSAFGSSREFQEHIIFKRFEHYDFADTHVAMLDGGARMITFGQPGGSTINGDTIPAMFTEVSDDRVLSHFLRCQPQT